MMMHERLRRARVAAGYPTMTAACEAFSWNRNTYGTNENGSTSFGRVAAERYARAYRVRLEWLLTGRGSMKDERGFAVPLLGYVGAGAEVFPMDDGDLGEVDAPS